MPAGPALVTGDRTGVADFPDHTELSEHLQNSVNRGAGDFRHAPPHIRPNVVDGRMVGPRTQRLEHRPPLRSEGEGMLVADLLDIRVCS